MAKVTISVSQTVQVTQYQPFTFKIDYETEVESEKDISTVSEKVKEIFSDEFLVHYDEMAKIVANK